MKINIKSFARVALGYARENTPLIMTATAIGGVVTPATLASQAGARIERLHDFSDAPEQQPAKTIDYVKRTWKVWIPTVISGALTIGSVVMIHYTHQKRYAALMGLYALGNQAFQEYRESIDEVLDDKTKEEVKQRVVSKAVHRNEDDLDEALGDVREMTLCYDTFSGRFFQSDIESIRRAENEFNKGLISHNYGSLNELYSLMGIGGVGAGEDIGWNSDNLLSIGYNSILTERGVPAMSIDFHDCLPTHNYYKNF